MKRPEQRSAAAESAVGADAALAVEAAPPRGGGELEQIRPHRRGVSTTSASAARATSTTGQEVWCGTARTGDAARPRQSRGGPRRRAQPAMSMLVKGQEATLRLLDEALARPGSPRSIRRARPSTRSKHEALSMLPARTWSRTRCSRSSRRVTSFHDRLLRAAKVIVAR